MNNARKGRKERWVAVSGGFDPIHIGHVRYLESARKLGEKLVVILNNDNWLHNKKGFVFMPEQERQELLEMFPFVDKVVLTDHKPADPDISVVRALQQLKPEIFANGGDRFKDDIPEAVLCRELGITMRFNVGRGGKVQSSSWMLSKARRDSVRSVRPWGEFYGWDAGESWFLKTLYIQPKKRLSLQYHKGRSELWVLVSGDATATIGVKGGKLKRTQLKKGELFVVPRGTIHRLETKKGGVLVEIAQGKFDENDIIRLEDDHGRV